MDDKLLRLKKLFAMGSGEVPAESSLVFDQKEDLMAEDITPEILKQFAGEQMAADQGYEKYQRVSGPEGVESVQVVRLTPEEIERKKLAIQKLMQGK